MSQMGVYASPGFLAQHPSLTNPIMSVTTKKPLPPALSALKPILDALPLEEGSDDEMDGVNIKDFSVRHLVISSELLTNSSFDC